MQNTARTPTDTLNSFKGFPTLAGLCSFEAAAPAGLSVDEVVSSLKRFHWTARRAWHILMSRITAEPVYELKMGLSYHAHLCAELVTELRARVGELREPPLGLDECPDEALDLAFDEILCADTTLAVTAGIYGVVLPSLAEGMRRHIASTHPLADAPTIRLLRRALEDVEAMLAWGRQSLAALAALSPTIDADAILAEFRSRVAAAGGIDGHEERIPPQPRSRSAKPFRYDPVPQRDERFPIPSIRE